MRVASRFSGPAGLLTLSFLLSCLAVFSTELAAQEATYQRNFPIPVAEAKSAVQKVGATSKGRLPTLEGFVERSDQPLERFDKGYYECSFQVSAVPSGAVVRATAKVTAWYSDPIEAHSGYRILVSNGRLEADALERIAERLSLDVPTPAAAASASPSVGSLSSVNLRPSVQLHPNAPAFSVGSGAASSAAQVTAEPPVPLSTRATLESVRALRAADEKKSSELSNYIKNLEEIQRNQSHPNNLAAVKKPRTPVFAKPDETARILLNAEQQDEFQVLGLDGAWVHVEISGVSRGWIRRTQLEMPIGFSQATGTPARNPYASDAVFRVAREETTPFSGSWAPLKGRTVRIEWIEPANASISTSRREKLLFAKSVFLHASENLPNASQAEEGVVVVFDSADGGQIAAALQSVKALANHTLSEAAFWHQCSVDPLESFFDSAKP
jgi:hypothetical protein